MIRVLFSIIFVGLILALGICAQTAFHSHKAIGRSVALLLIGLIPPVIGNLVIICSTYKLGATIGSYIYFLGMDLAVYALLRFTFDYCSISWPNRALRLLVDALLILDVVQLLLNPVFHHAFDNEAILVGGATYFRLLPFAGQSFHRIVDYGIFAAALIIFFLKALRSPRINSERYSVILAAMVFTGLWQTFYIFSRTPIDRSMIGFGVLGLLVYYLALYYRPMRLLDRMLATIASELPEALFFFEMSSQCIWANRPALELTGAGDGDFDLAAERLHDLICSKFALMNEDLADTSDGLPPVSVSAGIAFGADAADASALFEHADHALYESKHKGRCRFTFFDAAEAT